MPKMDMRKMLTSRILILGLPIIFLLSEPVEGQRVTGQSAAEAFSLGEYQKAYDQYMILLESFPRDPLYLYGAGVSLVKLKRLPAEAADLIDRAITSTSAIRTIPGEALFYLGRALHMAGRYDEATDAYEKFSDAAGRREARALGVQDLIRDCVERRGEIEEQEKEKEMPVIVDSLSVKDTNMPEPLPVATDSLLDAALRHRLVADSLKREAGTDTALLRQSSADIAISDSIMAKAGIAVKDTSVRDIKLPEEVPVTKIDVSDEAITTGDTLKPDPLARVERNQEQEIPITSLFELKAQSHYDKNNPITVSSGFPDGFFYSIQMAVFRNPVAPSHFKGLFPVFGIKTPGSELTFYYAGLFRAAADASKALPVVRNQGFRDAFVVIFMDGKPVSAERGSILEKEWAARGFDEWSGVVPKAAQISEPADTVPPMLLFRVEVMRTNKEIEARQLTALEKIAAGKGLDIMNPSASVFVYLVGKFLTFESASSYADLLVRNGYKEARVAAYLGSREIPVETALKYFDR